jgi:hypothetical protein
MHIFYTYEYRTPYTHTAFVHIKEHIAMRAICKSIFLEYGLGQQTDTEAYFNFF